MASRRFTYTASNPTERGFPGPDSPVPITLIDCVQSELGSLVDLSARVKGLAKAKQALVLDPPASIPIINLSVAS
jgi:hypothetical protein